MIMFEFDGKQWYIDYGGISWNRDTLAKLIGRIGELDG